MSSRIESKFLLIVIFITISLSFSCEFGTQPSLDKDTNNVVQKRNLHIEIKDDIFESISNKKYFDRVFPKKIKVSLIGSDKKYFNQQEDYYSYSKNVFYFYNIPIDLYTFSIKITDEADRDFFIANKVVDTVKYDYNLNISYKNQNFTEDNQRIIVSGGVYDNLNIITDKEIKIENSFIYVYGTAQLITTKDILISNSKFIFLNNGNKDSYKNGIDGTGGGGGSSGSGGGGGSNFKLGDKGKDDGRYFPNRGASPGICEVINTSIFQFSQGGSGGNGGGYLITDGYGGIGGAGGGSFFISSNNLDITDSIISLNGQDGSNGGYDDGGGGGGAGGEFMIKSSTINISGSSKINLFGGMGGMSYWNIPDITSSGGNGANGDMKIIFTTLTIGSKEYAPNQESDLNNDMFTNDSVIVLINPKNLNTISGNIYCSAY